MTIPYGDRLTAAVQQRGALCVGIDPHPALLSSWSLPLDSTGLERCARSMVAALGDLVAVFKPQSAFFESHGSAGIAVLERVVGDIAGTGALCLLDVKRGDIGSTMDAYAAAYLADGAPLAADAITLSPYLGVGALAKTIELAGRTGRGVYLLAQTSNPEGPVVQLARTADGATVAETVIATAAGYNATATGLGHVGVVIGATVAAPAGDLSGLNGSILAPGLGAQGGTAESLKATFGAALPLVLPSTSREVMAAGPAPDDLRAAVRRTRGHLSAAGGLR